MKIDNIDLTHQINLSIFTDFLYQSVKSLDRCRFLSIDYAGHTSKQVTNWRGTCQSNYLFLSTHENEVFVKVTGSRKLENGHVVPGTFRARTQSRAITTKFEQEMSRLKQLCGHMDISVSTLKKIPPFSSHTFQL